MKKYLGILTLLFVFTGFADTALAQLEPPPHKRKKQTEKSKLDRRKSIKRHTKKHKKGLTKAEIRRRSTSNGQARRRYKISKGRKGGMTKASRNMRSTRKKHRSRELTKAAKRMSSSERRRKRTLRRKTEAD